MPLNNGLAAGAAAALAVGAALFLLAGDEIEDVIRPQADVLRPPDGSWIPSLEGKRAELWAVGDADPPAARRVAGLLRRARPDRILYLGDVYPHGSAADFRRWARPFGSLVKRMAPTAGNHEWSAADEGYEPFWKAVTGKPPPTYYEFEAGGWQILSANSEHSRHAAVASWLRRRSSSGGNCRIAFWHSPRFSAGELGGGDAAEDLWEAIEGRARIVLNAHDHNMQRFEERGGTVEFISGTGGRNLHAVDRDDPGLAFADDANFGALRLSLRPGRARWRFVAAGGTVLDSGSLRCRE